MPVTLTKRSFITGSIATSIALQTNGALSQTGNWPSREIHLLCGFPPGSGADLVVRFFAEKLRGFISQPILVENRPGAGTSIAWETVARAKPDGHTLIINPGNAIANNTYLYKKLGYDPVNDFAPVTTLLKLPFVLCTRPGHPAKDLNAFIAEMKSKGDKATYAYSSNFALACGELFKERTGIKAVGASYKSMPDIIGDTNNGLVDFFFGDITAVAAQGKAGRIRLLGVTTAARSSILDNVPTLEESGVPDFDLQGWWGAWYPANTPPAIVKQMASWLNTIISSDEGKKFFAQTANADAFPGTPESLAEFVRAEVPRWIEIFKLAKLQPE